jgi:hypothetical protein
MHIELQVGSGRELQMQYLCVVQANGTKTTNQPTNHQSINQPINHSIIVATYLRQIVGPAALGTVLVLGSLLQDRTIGRSIGASLRKLHAWCIAANAMLAILQQL